MTQDEENCVNMLERLMYEIQGVMEGISELLTSETDPLIMAHYDLNCASEDIQHRINVLKGIEAENGEYIKPGVYDKHEKEYDKRLENMKKEFSILDDLDEIIEAMIVCDQKEVVTPKKSFTTDPLSQDEVNDLLVPFKEKKLK